MNEPFQCGWCQGNIANHSMHCQRPEVFTVNSNRYWKLVLNEYHRHNLLWLFQVCGALGYPFNSGDWFGEIPEMLAPGTRVLADGENANITVEAGISAARKLERAETDAEKLTHDLAEARAELERARRDRDIADGAGFKLQTERDAARELLAERDAENLRLAERCQRLASSKSQANAGGNLDEDAPGPAPAPATKEEKRQAFIDFAKKVGPLPTSAMATATPPPPDAAGRGEPKDPMACPMCGKNTAHMCCEPPKDSRPAQGEAKCGVLRGPEQWHPTCSAPPDHEGPHIWGEHRPWCHIYQDKDRSSCNCFPTKRSDEAEKSLAASEAARVNAERACDKMTLTYRKVAAERDAARASEAKALVALRKAERALIGYEHRENIKLLDVGAGIYEAIAALAPSSKEKP